MSQKQTWHMLKTDEKVSGIYSKKLENKLISRGTILYTTGTSSTNIVTVHSSEQDGSNFQCKKENLEVLNGTDMNWLIAVSDVSDRYSIYNDDTRWRSRFMMNKGQRVKVKKAEFDHWVPGVVRSVGRLPDKKGTWIQVEIISKRNGNHPTRHTVSVNLSQVQLDKQIGWACPRCTVFNLPYLPECHMCEEKRPENYTIPDDYIPTKEEEAIISQNKESRDGIGIADPTIPRKTESHFDTAEIHMVNVYIEDQCEAGTYICMKLNPKQTFSTLKQRFHSQLSLPPEVQCWMVNKEVPHDFDTLSQWGITKTGNGMHLYIKLPKQHDVGRIQKRLNDAEEEQTNTVQHTVEPSAPLQTDLEEDDLSKVLDQMSTTQNEEYLRQPAKEEYTGPYIRVRINIEEKHIEDFSLLIDVVPLATFGNLKETIEMKWNIPVNHQRLMIGMMVPGDNDRLESNGIVNDEQPIHLYILSPKKIRTDTLVTKPTKQDNENNQTGARPKEPTEALSRYSLPSTSRIQRKGRMKSAKSNKPNKKEKDRLAARKHIRPTTAKRRQNGWTCKYCSFINLPLRPGCEMCSKERPPEYIVPQDTMLSEKEERFVLNERQAVQQYEKAVAKEERLRQEEAVINFERLQQAVNQSISYTTQEEYCSICMDTCPAGEGVRLRECLHVFCRDCLASQVEHCQEAVVPCPSDQCQASITESEIRQLVSAEVLSKYLQRGLQVAESQEPNSYHCKTADCPGWCIYDARVNTFSCPSCKKVNCLTCKAIHENMNCKQYQDDIVNKAKNNKEAQQTQQHIEELLRTGDAMRCPSCKIVLQKKYGCDWMECTMCKTELCWATRGPRWGPKGNGDTSGGCRCGVNGRRCHPDCQNCH